MKRGIANLCDSLHGTIEACFKLPGGFDHEAGCAFSAALGSTANAHPLRPHTDTAPIESLRRRRGRLPARDAIHSFGLRFPPAHLFHGARLRLDVYAARVLPFDGERVGIEHSVASVLVA